MVASSEQQSAPVIVINPATAQASSSQPGAPIKRADSADVIKTPDPIIDPITIMVASSGPSARTRPACGEGSISLFICKTLAREFPRLLFPSTHAIGERIPQLVECHHAHKSFR